MVFIAPPFVVFLPSLLTVCTLPSLLAVPPLICSALKTAGSLHPCHRRVLRDPRGTADTDARGR